MILNYDELINQVRIDLHHPQSHFPDDDLILQKLSDVSQELRNRASLLGSGALQRSETFTVLPSQYPVNLSSEDFGRIIRVHLSDSTSPQRQYYKVPVIDRQDIGHYSDFLSSEVPHVCVIWIEGGQRKLEFIPAVSQTWYGKVWYETGAVRIAKGDQADLVPEYYSLLRAKSSLLSLPYCDWDYLRAEDKTIPLLDREKLYDYRKDSLQKKISASLAAIIAASEQRYDQYVASLSHGGYESNELFAQDYVGSWF